MFLPQQKNALLSMVKLSVNKINQLSATQRTDKPVYLS